MSHTDQSVDHTFESKDGERDDEITAAIRHTGLTNWRIVDVSENGVTIRFGSKHILDEVLACAPMVVPEVNLEDADRIFSN